ncbi:AI-2E family transporter [Candidatus Gottesmanbacteria bacterium]|nr:AI-2E family transporter [Candidatus Gottesmanbacteria bacterium]
MTSKIELSHKTIIFTVSFLIALWVLVQIRDILFLIFIAFILMAALRPLVEALARIRIPRLLSIFVIYTVVFGVFGVSLAGTIPALIVQSASFIQNLPSFIERVLPYWNIDARALTAQIAPVSENIVRLTVGLFSNIFTTLTVLVFTFYFLLERRHVEPLLVETMGVGAAGQIMSVVREIEARLGAWIRGQIILMAIVGVLVYIGLMLLKVEFALPLAIIAGILEIVPTIGPIVSAIPAVFVALATSPFLALSVVALYFIIQQLENNLIVPIVMKKSTGLSPLITIFALMVGARFAGIVGAVLAVPMVLVFQVVIGAFLAKPSK